jgi:xylose isomerase
LAIYRQCLLASKGIKEVVGTAQYSFFARIENFETVLATEMSVERDEFAEGAINILSFDHDSWG